MAGRPQRRARLAAQAAKTAEDRDRFNIEEDRSRLPALVPDVPLNVANWKHRCTATNSRGERCQKWSMKGSFTCSKHGGMAPQVRAAAAERIREQAQASILNLVPPAVKRLQELLLDSSQDSVSLRAALEILDRNGMQVVRRSETKTEVKLGAQEQALDAVLAQLIDQRAREMYGGGGGTIIEGTVIDE